VRFLSTLDVNWKEYACVQDCDESEGGGCGGRSQWNAHLFVTQDYCCAISISWAIDDCRRIPTKTTLTESVGDGKKCPKEYSQLNEYTPGDRVAIGRSVYECITGPSSQFCNIYSPDFAAANDGGSVGVLGWMESQPCEVKTEANEIEADKEFHEIGDSVTDWTQNNSQDIDPDIHTLQGSFLDRPYRPEKPSGTFTLTQGALDADDQIGPSCWRSGTPCESHAEYFACCTQCLDNVCQ